MDVKTEEHTLCRSRAQAEAQESTGQGSRTYPAASKRLNNVRGKENKHSSFVMRITMATE